MTEEKKYYDPNENPFIRRESDSETSGLRKYPDIVSADEVREAARSILINGLECEARIEEINDELYVNGKRLIDLKPEDITPILDAVQKEKARIQAAEKEVEREKYLNPETNPMIKTDPEI